MIFLIIINVVILYVSSDKWNSLLNSLVSVTSGCVHVERQKKNALYKYSNNENIPYQF